MAGGDLYKGTAQAACMAGAERYGKRLKLPLRCPIYTLG